MILHNFCFVFLDPSSLGVSLTCPSLGCQLLSVEMDGMKNITRNCLSGDSKVLMFFAGEKNYETETLVDTS